MSERDESTDVPWTRRFRELHFSNPAKPGPPPERPPATPQPRNRRRALLVVVGIVVAFALLSPALSTSQKPATAPLTFSAFVHDVQNNGIVSATIGTAGTVTGTLKGGKSYESQIPLALGDNQLAALLEQHGVTIAGAGPEGSLLGALLSFLPLIFIVGIFLYFSRASRRQVSGVMGIGSSRAKLYDLEKPVTRFSDVAGYEGAKREVAEVVTFLKYPGRFERAGAIGPRGVLLVGPPGTGKTLLARAVAGEAEVPFFAVTGSSFVELFVGVGASRVRDLFAAARKRAPSIIFIDEVDAVGHRGGVGFASNDEKEQTLNQLLSEMDGFDARSGVVVIAATNRPEALDPALLRPGRFDRHIEIPLPNRAERTAILRVHMAGRSVAPDVDLDAVSRATPGFSGADLANLENEAAIVAVRDNRDTITAVDLGEARDRILLGRREAPNALLPEEKRAVAIHEAGHALVAALSPHSDHVAKITILPAGSSLGVTQLLPADERRLYPESYLQDSLAVRLGGRAAESLVLGEVSSGAANDLAGATQLATRMVKEFGMSPVVGPIGFAPEGPGYLGHEELYSRSYAEATQRIIDEEVTKLLRQAEQRASDLLRSYGAVLSALAQQLIEHETVEGDAVYEMLMEYAQGVTTHSSVPLQERP
jgi:cell division protease FtsH